MSIFDVCAFGAKGNGESNDAPSIQKAIDACAASGGGRVLFRSGRCYRSGTIVMKSNVELHLETGAVLSASGEIADYTQRFSVSSLSGGNTDHAGPGAIMFIWAEGARNISFTGSGCIDGGGRHFMEEDLGPIYRMKTERPFTFFLLDCGNVTLRDLTIRDGAHWTVRLSACHDVLVDGLRILNDLKLPNNDGIDLDRCRDVRISGCRIESGDDCIVLKACEETAAYGDMPCENVVVTGCTLKSSSIAICVGCECRAPMRNIVFDACTIRESHRGCAVRLSEGSDVENVIFSNMVIETRLYDHKWWGSGEPICVSAVPWDEKRDIGRIRNVRFVNLLCRGENGVYLEGWKADRVEGILFDSVRVELTGSAGMGGGRYDRRPCPGPWWSDLDAGFLIEPSSGFRLRNARDITLRNCEVVGAELNGFGPALRQDGVEGLRVEGFRS